mgnify:CR=1 FL=1
MRQRSPNAVEISAYVDGMLSPRDVAAFESRMAEDAALRQRVDETRQVVAMMRAMPLRETPRNYLITPSMVAETRPSPAPRRAPLFAMRLATSLVALAFVVASGLTLLQGGMTPRMALAPSAAPQEARIEEFVASTVEVEAEGASEVVALEAPAPADDEMTLKVAEVEATPVAAQEALTPEEALALESMPERGEATGMGGGGEASVEAPVADVAIAATNNTTYTEAMAAEEAEEEIAEEVQPLAAMPAPDGEVDAVEEAPGGVEALDVADEASARTFETQDTETGKMVRESQALSRPTAQWAIGLGVATALLAAITVWMSRHRRG